MRKIVNLILVLVVAVGVSACSGLPTSFDNVAYNNLVALKYKATNVQKSCGSPTTKQQVGEMRTQMDHILLYVNHTGSDEETVRSVNTISYQIDEMVFAYTVTPPSTAYCDIKAEILNEGISAILTTVGHK